MDLFTVVAGLGGGLCWAVLGFVRNKTTKEPEDFDAKKFIKSVIVGGAVGSYLAYSGSIVDISTIEAFLGNSVIATPLVGVAEKVASLIYGALGKAFNY